jgi:hypothetical protein
LKRSMHRPTRLPYRGRLTRLEWMAETELQPLCRDSDDPLLANLYTRRAMSVLIPTDPGVAWRLGRALVNRSAVHRMGLPYDYFMALEHVNPVNNLVAFLEYYFPKARRRWWPFSVASIDLTLFYAFHWVKPFPS